MISVLDYGVGNLGSILNMLKKVGVQANLARTPLEVELAERILLPGVGAFDIGMRRLRDANLVEPLKQVALIKKTPILGICLGMQLLGDGSDEGTEVGLGLIKGRVRKFHPDPAGKLKVPHMGWNVVNLAKESPLFPCPDMEKRFYFVHSYHFVCENEEDVLGRTEYGKVFSSMISRSNVLGAQFHPEKSHRFGMELLKNFSEI